MKHLLDGRTSYAGISVFLFVFICAFSPIQAHAASITWNGAGSDNNWSTGANWVGGVAPGTADTAVFGNTSLKNATVDASFGGAVGAVTINSTYTGTISLARSLTLTGIFTQSGGTFSAGSQTLSTAGFTVTAGTFNAGTGTVTFTGGSSTLTCTGVTFNLVSFATTGGSKGLSSGCNLPMGNNPPSTGTGGINLNAGSSISGSGTFTTGAALNLNGGTISGFSGFSLASLTASSTSAYDFSPLTSLTVSGATTFATSTITLPTAGATFAAVTLSGGAVLNASTGTTTVGGAFTSNSGSTFNGNGGVTSFSSGVTINTGATFNAGASTVNFGGAGGGAVTCNSATFGTVTFTNAGGTKAFNAGCNFTLGANPTIGGAGTISLNAGSSLSGSGTLTDNAGPLNLNGGTLVGFGGLAIQTTSIGIGTYDFSSYSPFTAAGMTLTTSAVVTLPTAGATFTGGITIGSGTTLNGSAGTTSVGGVFRLGVGGIYNSQNGTLAVASSFRNDGGTFNAGTGTVSLTGTTQSILGSTTFYNLSKTGSVGTLTFASSTTQTIQNSLTLRGGDASNLLTLNSDSSGTPWTLAPQATADLRFLNISDLNNTGAALSVYDSIDGGGNTNVNFLTTTVTTPAQTSHGSSSSSRGGTSIQGQVMNLMAMGKVAEANALKAQWPQLFVGIAQAATISPSSATTTAFQFLTNLKTGMTSTNVMELQKCLNKLGFTVALTGPGSPGNETTMFGAFTREALKKFQEAHASEVLAPIGLSSGTGVFAEMSRKAMNSILAAGGH